MHNLTVQEFAHDKNRKFRSIEVMPQILTNNWKKPQAKLLKIHLHQQTLTVVLRSIRELKKLNDIDVKQTLESLEKK